MPEGSRENDLVNWGYRGRETKRTLGPRARDSSLAGLVSLIPLSQGALCVMTLRLRARDSSLAGLVSLTPLNQGALPTPLCVMAAHTEVEAASDP